MKLYSQIRDAIFTHKRKLGISCDVKSISFKQLGYGENNTSVYVNVNGTQEFTFRIAMKRSRKKMLEKEKHMLNEFDILQKINSSIAPKPLLFDNSKKIIPRAYCVLSYVDGKIKNTWTDVEIRLHAKALIEIHSKKYTYFEEDGKKGKKLDLHYHYIHNWLPNFKKVLNDPQVKQIFPVFERYLEENNHLFLNLREFTRIHRDLANDNILFGTKGITYIDWEWACVGDPARDVARIFSTDFSVKPWFVRFSQKQKRLLLKTYLGKKQDDDFAKRVDVWNTILFFSDVLYCKWKVKNFHTQESGYSKKIYADTAKIILKSLKKKLVKH